MREPNATTEPAITTALVRGNDAARFDSGRLAMLLPDLPQAASADLLACALAFVTRYPRDVVLLEQEWEWLMAAARVAWQSDNDAASARLATALAHVVGRVADRGAATEALRRGIVASRRLGDLPTQARLMNRLGCNLNSNGAYEAGWRVWRASLLLHPAGMLAAIWEPFVSFAHVIDLITVFDAQGHISWPATDDASEGAVLARFTRGYLARIRDDAATAWAEMSLALRLLSRREGCDAQSPQHHLMRAVILAELARIQSHYPQARAQAMTAIALAQVYADTYTHATLLIDHMFFAYLMGQHADAQATYLQLRAIAGGITAPHIHHMCARWEAALCDAPSRALTVPALPPVAPIHALTAREREVLALVARGLSNQAIAQRLVITSGTVKKHLEHIFAKLAVHSRTAAIARFADLHPDA